MEPDKDALLLKIKNDALRLLTFRPRSVEELKQRLLQKKHDATLVEEVLELLRHQGLLDDEKFSKLFAQSKIYTQPSSKSKLVFELKRKGVSEPLIQKTLENIPEYDEKKMAGDLVSLRFKKMKGLSIQKKKQRMFGFLKRRGFSNEVIFSAMDKFFKDESELIE